jgi:hypothetical protein
MQVRNPSYSRADKSAIDVEVFHETYGWLPFTATETADRLSQQIYAAAVAGEYGAVREFAPASAPTEHVMAAVRMEREQRLLRTDWTDTLSAKDRLGEAAYARWQEYRQALRDIPSQSGFPFTVVWPNVPD